MTTLKISEIFKSIQGESSYSGFPFFFIRLTGCNLRCSYCDTKYAFDNGKLFTISNIIEKIRHSNVDKVLITGGEPLLQNNVYKLIDKLLDIGKKVFLETNGSLPIDKIRTEVTKIVDFKTPSSLPLLKNNFNNVKFLNKKDEIKFVVSDKNDFQWSLDIIKKYDLSNIVENILFSPVTTKLKPHLLAHWMLEKEVNFRFQLQLHKLIRVE
jgi:7-carboxy-7-deazaguanine synthase